MTKVREANPGDMQQMMVLASKMHAESRYAHLDFDAAKVFALGQVAIAQPELCIFVAEHDDKIIGMLVGFVQEYYFGKDKQAQDIMFYVDPEYRGSMAAVRLVQAYEKWAKQQGVKDGSIGIGVSAGITDERAGEFLKRLGYHVVATLYVKEA